MALEQERERHQREEQRRSRGHCAEDAPNAAERHVLPSLTETNPSVEVPQRPHVFYPRIAFRGGL